MTLWQLMRDDALARMGEQLAAEGLHVPRRFEVAMSVAPARGPLHVIEIVGEVLTTDKAEGWYHCRSLRTYYRAEHAPGGLLIGYRACDANGRLFEDQKAPAPAPGPIAPPTSSEDSSTSMRSDERPQRNDDANTA